MFYAAIASTSSFFARLCLYLLVVGDTISFTTSFSLCVLAYDYLATIRSQSASNLLQDLLLCMANDPALAKHGIQLQFGQVKNVNKNPVAEHAFKELGI